MMKDYIEGYHFKASNGNKYGTLIPIDKNKDMLTNMNKHGIKMNILLSQKIKNLDDDDDDYDDNHTKIKFNLYDNSSLRKY